MHIKSSEHVFATLQALAAKAGVTKDVLRQITTTDIAALASMPDDSRPQKIRETLNQAVVGDLTDNYNYLRAATTSRTVKYARNQSTTEGRGVVADDTFGYVSKSITNTSMMMENINRSDPKLYAAIVKRIEDSAENLAALKTLSKANYTIQSEETFEGNVTTEQLRQWFAGNAERIKPTVCNTSSPKNWTLKQS